MREIKNNVELAKMQSSGLKQDKAQKADISFGGENEEDVLKDFSNPTEVLGRSQVSSTDNVQHDITFGVANKKKISKSDILFEKAYNSLMEKGDPEAYEKACSIATCEEAKELL